MSDSKSFYEFVYRGQLADESLDLAGRPKRNLTGFHDLEVAQALAIDLLDDDLVNAAKRMSAVYAAIAAFENSARKLVRSVLKDALGEDWIEKGLTTDILKRARGRKEDEEKTRWHAPRGLDLIEYTELHDLGTIITLRHSFFEDYIPDSDWSKSIFRAIEKSRHVIMHSGTLHIEDVRRIGSNIRDWVKQLGS